MEQKEKIAAVILAAGKGTRMNDGKNGSDIPKVMFKAFEKPLIHYSVVNIQEAGIQKIVLVVGYKKELIEEFFGDEVEYAEQKEQLGTGHAAMMAEKSLKNKSEAVLVCYGDMPLYKPETIKQLINLYEDEKPAIAMLSVNFADPDYWVYGRILRNSNGDVTDIVEQKDCNPKQREIKECNPGFYIFDADWLWENFSKLKTNNAQHEYYLTDMIKIAVDQGKKVLAMPVSEEWEALGINTQEQLKQAEGIIQKLKLKNQNCNSKLLVEEKKKRAKHKIKSTRINNLGLVRKDGKILLAMKKRGFGAGWWNGYGGKLKPGETIEEALVREMEEESGIKIKKHAKKGILTFEFLGNSEAVEVHVYDILDHENEATESEEMKPAWFDLDKIPFDSMWPDDIHWMPLFLEGKNFVGKFLFDSDGSILDYEIGEATEI